MKRRLLILIAVVLIFSGCTPDNPSTSNNNQITVDPNVFFTISFNGRALTTNGLINSTNNSLALTFKSYMQASATSIGSTETHLQIQVMGSILNAQAGNTSNNVNASIHIKKQGGSIGTYDISPDTVLGNITDLSTNSTLYLINNNGSVVVTNIDQNYITGTFSFLLVDGTNLIPASGSFKLNKF